jgi:hypothetical protein
MRGAVPGLIAELDRHGGLAAATVGAVLGSWVAWKLWQRQPFRRLAAPAHVTAAKLRDAMAIEQPPLLVDLRGAGMIAQTGPIAGAVVAEHDLLEQAVRNWPRHRPVVTICTCPQDAGAIEAAQRLLAQGGSRCATAEGWLRRLDAGCCVGRQRDRPETDPRPFSQATSHRTALKTESI